jgi:hypothetical protein
MEAGSEGGGRKNVRERERKMIGGGGDLISI